MEKGTLCPFCGKGALRRSNDTGAQVAIGELRFCRPCHAWVRPFTLDDFDRKYRLGAHRPEPTVRS